MLEDVIQLHRGGRLDEAEAGYRELLAERPDDAEVMHLLGILRGQRGDLPGALELVQRASRLDPESATCQHTLGEMYFRAGRLDDAEQAYARARALNPNIASVHVGLGRIALLRGNLDGAESDFKVALRADADDAQALTGLGNVARLRGDPKAALQWLNQAAELAVDDPVIQTSYAQAMLDQGLLDFAAKALDNALTIRPDYPLAQALLADVHVRKGEFDAALPAFEALLARGEQVVAAHVGLGDIARAQGRTDVAVAQYDEALRLRPGLHHVAVRRADALGRGARIPEAIEYLRTYIAGHPHAAGAQVALAHMLTQTRQYDEAIAVCAAAAAHWPQDVKVRAQYALTLDHAGRTDEALATAELAADSPRPAIALLRARGALLAGDPAAAVQRLQRVTTAALAGRPVRLARRRQRLLGLAYDSLEQWPEAVAAFLRAHALMPRRSPELPVLDTATRGRLREVAEGPVLAPSRGAPPVLLCGLPGSGVEQVAALLGDHAQCRVRRDRFGSAQDFLDGPYDPQLLQPFDENTLVLLAHRYRRALERIGTPAEARVIDWVPLLDVRVVPALARALPGARLVLVQRPPHALLLDWLAFPQPQGFALSDPVAGARWLRVAQTHLVQAAGLLPTLRVDPDALAAGADARAQLAMFLDTAGLQAGPQARAAATSVGGLPVAFPIGHAERYRETLSQAFALLDESADFR